MLAVIVNTIAIVLGSMIGLTYPRRHRDLYHIPSCHFVQPDDRGNFMRGLFNHRSCGD